MKQLKIREHEINFTEIINLAFLRKNWGKTYTVFTLNDITINITMRNFYFDKNKAEFKIKILYPSDKYTDNWSEYEILDYFLENFTLDDIKLLMYKKIYYLMNNTIKNRTRTKAKEIYKQYKYNVWNLKKEHYKKVGFEDEYNKIQLIDNEDILEECLNILQDKTIDILNEDYNNKIDIYYIQNKNVSKSFLELQQKVNNKIDNFFKNKK